MNFDLAMNVTKEIIEADPFFGREMRKFYVAVRCIMISAKTGKGVYIARKRHIPAVYNYAHTVADATGTVETIMAEVEKAVKVILEHNKRQMAH